MILTNSAIWCKFGQNQTKYKEGYENCFYGGLHFEYLWLYYIIKPTLNIQNLNKNLQEYSTSALGYTASSPGIY